MISKQSFYLSVLSGILLSLPWLSPGLSGMMFFAFVPLFFAENQLFEKKGQRHIPFFFLALASFLIWNVLATWWIGYVSVPGMLLIAVSNAGLMAIVFNLAHSIRKRFSTISGYFSLLVFWIAFEFLQHYWAIPWPWLTLGNAFANTVKVIQWYEFTGVFGGSLWVLLSNILIFEMIRNFSGKSFPQSAKLLILVLIVVFFPLLFSISLYSNFKIKGPSLNILVLQPNIDPYTDKFSGMSPDEQLERLLSLAGSKLSDSTDFFIAPETALPIQWEDSLVEHNQTPLPISELMQEFPEVGFMAGAMTQRKFAKGEVISETARQSTDGRFYYDVFNSALLIDQPSGIQISHKSILVNGAEKMPFQKYFSFLGKYLLQLGGTGGSLASGEPVLFSGKDVVKIGPVICFESVFGEYCSKLVKKGASLLVVLTNDGWWKESAGGWQHFGYARLRAVETRRSVVQCANTGISGFINPRGDVLMKTEVNAIAALSSPVHLNAGTTYYTLHGDFIGKICLILSGLILVFFKMEERFGWDKKNPH